MPFCSKCGAKAIEGARFCAACGQKLYYAPAADSGSAPAVPAQAPVADIPAAPSAPAQEAPVFTPPAAPVQEAPVFTPPAASVQEAPVFTPPAAPAQEAPVFTPPVAPAQEAPVFTPPAAPVQEAPVFTPPAAPVQEAPVFTPPAAPVQEAPVFTPPAAPKFAPPANTHTHSGPCCAYHKSEPAVAKCARCGRFLCQDCFDSYGVTDGEYAGRALCYDCTQKLVADNVAELTKNKNKIKFQFILSLIGISIGFILGLMCGISEGAGAGTILIALIFAAIGGVFLSALKAFCSLSWEVIKIAFDGNFGVLTFFSVVINIFVLIFKCFYTTISNTIYYIKYLKQTSGFIESDQACLDNMRDYMEYTMIRNQNPGVDIETLLNENSALADNTVAQMARTQTEEQIEAAMRNCVATINENGEIIRSFRDNTEKKAA